MFRFSLFLFKNATRPTFTLKPVLNSEELSRGLALASKVFSEEEGLSVIQNLTAEQINTTFSGLHKSFELAAEKGIYLSHIAVEDTVCGKDNGDGKLSPPRVGAAFIVFPASLKVFDEASIPPPFFPIGQLIDHLYELAKAAEDSSNHSRSATGAETAITTLPSNFYSYTPLANQDKDTTVWFGIAAVADFARGQGLQKLAKKAVVEAARAHGFKSIVTECTSPASAKSMMSDVGANTKGCFARVTLPYSEYNGGEFNRCVTEFNCNAAVLVEELL